MEKQEILNQLFQKYINDQCSPQEVDQLMALLLRDENGRHAGDLIEQHMSGFPVSDKMGTDQELRTRLEKRLQAILHAEMPAHSVTRLRRMTRVWWAAAAACVLTIAGYWFFTRPAPSGEPAIVNRAPPPINAPDVNRAAITLANGRIVYLDSSNNGLLTTQQGVKLIKSGDGLIAYEGNAGIAGNAETIFNILNNPRGSRVVTMTLSDGSRVWLNAGSSITYPVSFSENERKVTVAGEAYFEVQHNPAIPFIVQTQQTVVQVLGTHFNVNAYQDDNTRQITLLQGSVRVTQAAHEEVLKPGEQAIMAHGAGILVKKAVDMRRVMAWKNGWFEFGETDLQTIMKQLSRWYDIEIGFETQPGTETFGGRISRDLPLQQVLKLLENNGVSFQLTGRKLIVKP